MGYVEGDGRRVQRIGFRHPPGLFEGPYDILRFALRRLGDEAGAAAAERMFVEAKAAREADADPPEPLVAVGVASSID